MSFSPMVFHAFPMVFPVFSLIFPRLPMPKTHGFPWWPGDVRLGFIQEPNVVPHWVHLGCLRRARLQAIGASVATDPRVTLEDRRRALEELGRRGRNARDLERYGKVKKNWKN